MSNILVRTAIVAVFLATLAFGTFSWPGGAWSLLCSCTLGMFICFADGRLSRGSRAWHGRWEMSSRFSPQAARKSSSVTTRRSLAFPAGDSPTESNHARSTASGTTIRVKRISRAQADLGQPMSIWSTT
jgi:hypothetical protein